MNLPFNLLSELIAPWSKEVDELEARIPGIQVRLDAAKAAARQRLREVREAEYPPTPAGNKTCNAGYRDALGTWDGVASIEGEFDAAKTKAEILKAAITASRNFSVGMDRRTAIRQALKVSWGYDDCKAEDRYGRALNRYTQPPGEPVDRAETFRNEVDRLVPKTRPLDDSRMGMAIRATQ